MDRTPFPSSSRQTTTLLLRNTVWNLLGEGAPLLVALVAIPQLVNALGTARFGMLTLVWMLIGYFTLFDFGLGRALTNLVAKELGSGKEGNLPSLIWTGNIMIGVLGIIGSLFMAGLAHWLVTSALKIPNELHSEMAASLYIISLVLPAVICTTGFRGVLEAYQRFDLANAIRIPMGIYSFAAPLLVLPFSHSLVPVVATLAAGRFIAFLTHIGLCIRLIPALRSAVRWSPELVGPMLKFGGWMTISNLINPFMMGMDRFLIGALLSIQAVAFYSAAYEIVSKLLLIPVAAAGVLFPAFSTSLEADIEHARSTSYRAAKLLVLVTIGVAVPYIICAHRIFAIWLGANFARYSTLPLQILTLGLIACSVGTVPFAVVQGAGRADWTAKLQLMELPAYLAIFWILTTRFGIVGTAITWSLRMTADVIVLTVMAIKILKSPRQFRDQDVQPERQKPTAMEQTNC